jgi:hypothetical protein
MAEASNLAEGQAIDDDVGLMVHHYANRATVDIITRSGS